MNFWIWNNERNKNEQKVPPSQQAANDFIHEHLIELLNWLNAHRTRFDLSSWNHKIKKSAQTEIEEKTHTMWKNKQLFWSNPLWSS